jgi:chemotaxis protein CheD
MDNHAAPEHIYLKPGDILISEKPVLISTLLGSCVAVTMFSPRLRVGAISHGLLPSCKKRKPCEGDEYCREGVRYVECSIMRMLGWFMQNGVAREEIDVKVFGGSDMLSVPESTTKATVGQQNIAMAFHVLEKEMLRVSASDVGGLRGRKIIFSSKTGEVMLKRLRNSELENL